MAAIARGRGEVRASTNRIEVTGSNPDRPVVLRFHWMEQLVCEPDCTIERKPDKLDPVGFIKIPAPHPAERGTGLGQMPSLRGKVVVEVGVGRQRHPRNLPASVSVVQLTWAARRSVRVRCRQCPVEKARGPRGRAHQGTRRRLAPRPIKEGCI